MSKISTSSGACGLCYAGVIRGARDSWTFVNENAMLFCFWCRVVAALLYYANECTNIILYCIENVQAVWYVSSVYLFVCLFVVLLQAMID